MRSRILAGFCVFGCAAGIVSADDVRTVGTRRLTAEIGSQPASHTPINAPAPTQLPPVQSATEIAVLKRRPNSATKPQTPPESIDQNSDPRAGDPGAKDPGSRERVRRASESFVLPLDQHFAKFAELTDEVSHSLYRTDMQQQQTAEADSIELVDSTSSPISELIPMALTLPPSNVTFSGDDDQVNLVATGAQLDAVLRMIAQHHGLNLVLGPDVRGPVTVDIKGVRLDEVLDAICGVAGFNWHQAENLLYVTGQNSDSIAPMVQGRYLHVYSLDYISARDAEAVINGLLSRVGKAFISEAFPDDQLRTRESLIVEDTRDSHERIAQYLAQVDTPPKQVLVEAHVLQIMLTNDQRHGINLSSLARLQNTEIRIEGTGFAETPNAASTTTTTNSGPSLAFRVDGNDMDALIELIEECTNSRTLASPKLSVVNHQEARIQIGQRLPYSVATTTQTTTVQNIQFLEVGVVLTVRPVITADGNVLMTVMPKVSGGKISSNGFPEEDTTEVSTTVLMRDGGGVVIGGLIREENRDSHAMVPVLGRIPVLGRLFKRDAEETNRNELVVALVTHVLDDPLDQRTREAIELEQTVPPYAAQELLQSQWPAAEVQ